MNTRPQQNSQLNIFYQQRDKLVDLDGDPNTLAIIDFGSHSEFSNDKTIMVGAPPLSGGDYVEVWQTNEQTESGTLGAIHYLKTPALIFGRILADSGMGNIELITHDIYKQISQLQHELGYTKMIRMWNYLPWITRHDNDMERYQSFCVGRHQAIDTSKGYESHLPAATAIGTRDDKVLVYFIAGHEDGIQIENPRQVSAFQYPQQYAPKSPVFSRALVKRWGEQTHLYISGTASIIGHQTRHIGKLLEQLDECLDNIDVLILEASKQSSIGIRDISELTGIKIYLRQQENLLAVLSHIKQRVGENAHVLVLEADICRTDLMLEIEGFYVKQS